MGLYKLSQDYDYDRYARYLPLAATLLGLGTSGTLMYLMAKNNEKIPPVTKKQINSLYKNIGTDPHPPMVPIPKLNNAFYANGSTAERLAKAIQEDPEYAHKYKKLVPLILDRKAVIGYDPIHGREGVLAHELGHAIIDQQGGFRKFNQNYGRLLPAITTLGLLGTGLALHANGVDLNSIGNQLPAIVGGLEGLSFIPTLVNEYQASSIAKKYLDKYGNPAHVAKNKKALNYGFGTYLTGALAPVLGGAAYTTYLNTR